jgi:hypothetical protein
MAEMRDKVTPAIARELRSTARVKLFWHVRSAKGPRRRWVTGDDFEIPMPLLCSYAATPRRSATTPCYVYYKGERERTP